MTNKRRRATLCPCGSEKPYTICCAPFHKKKAFPSTPVKLMRSRYSAYALGLTDYIIATTDPDGDAYKEDRATWRKSIENFTSSAQFEGVEILDSSEDGDHGEVHFLAKLKADNEDRSFEEHSIFTRNKGRWLYCGGETT